ncbi:hypothetical protein niasHT_013135 [Heterodera trifolii]|uniref:Glutathione synthetase n=1 Tax=Heterodera trifolii TaxID=157864 RepID=A0ABD2L787_9BILA
MSTILNLFLIVFTSFFVICAFSGDVTPSQHNDDEETSVEETEIINEQEINRLAKFAIEWCHNNGLVMRQALGSDHNIGGSPPLEIIKERGDIAGFPPLTLFPSPFPRSAFEQAMNVQEAMNLLYFRVARDFDFLMDAFKDVTKADNHIAKLVELAKEIHEEGIRQPITVMLQRADYLLNVVENNETNEVKYEPKQVEINTGAIGATGLKRRTTELHRRMAEKAGMDASEAHIPQNKPDEAKVKALYEAWRLFNDPNAIMLFLCYPYSPFNYDLQYIEDELHKMSGGIMKIHFYALFDLSEYHGITERLKLDPEDFSLRLDGKKVAVVYSGLTFLGCRLGKHGLKMRRMIERSTAIKAPSLFVALTGAKKVQQMLAMPGAIERFFPEPSDTATVEQIRATFAGLWGLENEDDDTEKLIEDAIENPGNYVLKPNKECGGNNFYDDKLVKKLKEFTSTERSAHILMQKLRPMVVKNYLLRVNEVPKQADVIPELGVYGFLIGDLVDGRVLHNVQQGYHFRTKLSHVNEGGVSAGFGFYDTAYLV